MPPFINSLLADVSVGQCDQSAEIAGTLNPGAVSCRPHCGRSEAPGYFVLLGQGDVKRSSANLGPPLWDSSVLNPSHAVEGNLVPTSAGTG